MKLRDSGEKVQAAMAGLSAWLDMKMEGKSYETNVDSDVLVSHEAIAKVSAAWVGSASKDDPLIDLINSNLKGLPPIYLATGSAEMVASDAERLAERARAAGVEVHLELSEGMQHLYFFMVGKAPEADKTMRFAHNFLKEKLGL
ncbi:Alpha/Beta hydrolase protein [Ilyonectria robusta]|uniref:Alpha/Beta hydrolase protein n=1 Tax=Ilyonectria robusta TaxID=1079257 RepID=UPI001E8CB41D|nr:Alpha/Beta hydrolase protein [Ilyonectria robusta]KAH8694350.1 Alpha/Beta hydrolase protein [Ilyonectria robusta]